MNKSSTLDKTLTPPVKLKRTIPPCLHPDSLLPSLVKHYEKELQKEEMWELVPKDLGNDIDALLFVLRDVYADQYKFFIKAVVEHSFRECSALVPHYLSAELSMEEILSPLKSKTGKLYLRVKDDGSTGSPSPKCFCLVVFPFIYGTNAMELEGGLSDTQAKTFGQVMSIMHRKVDVSFILSYAPDLPVESFCSPHLERVKRTHTVACKGPNTGNSAQVCGRGQENVQTALVSLWVEHREQIELVLNALEELGERLQLRTKKTTTAKEEGESTGAAGMVLCHADCHTANIMVDLKGSIRIVDWDTVVVAPPERDLMFIEGTPHKEHFMKGYYCSADRGMYEPEEKVKTVNQKNQRSGGKQEHHADVQQIEPKEMDKQEREQISGTELSPRCCFDPLAMGYYRCEWVVQELADCADRVLFMEDVNETAKLAAVEEFRQLFEPGDVFEAAKRSCEAAHILPVKRNASSVHSQETSLSPL